MKKEKETCTQCGVELEDDEIKHEGLNMCKECEAEDMYFMKYGAYGE